MQGRFVGAIDYSNIIQAAAFDTDPGFDAALLEELVYAARDAYLDMTQRPTDIARVTHGSFDYIYDDYASLEAQGLVPPHPTMEARLVIAIGKSTLRQAKRDDSRLRNWSGPKLDDGYGAGWDRGHFIAYSIGGVVKGVELNVFVQRRDLNRGWKSHPRSHLYRRMEKCCASREGILCFSRPIYLDETAKPSLVEFGVLKPNRELWVEIFDNRSLD